MIKFTEYLNENKRNTYKYGCAMLYFDLPELDKYHNSIKEEDLHKNGIEDEPHCTLLYGLHEDVDYKEVIDIILSYDIYDIEMSLHNMSLFENEEFDVIKFDVKCDVLNDINSKLCELPHTTDYPDYHPHATIAYVLPGKGNDYLKEKEELKAKVSKIVYSLPSGEKLEFILNR